MKREYISRELILRISKENILAIGEQIKANHTDCPAGNDTRQRLYIKRKENGLVAYCHNCSSSGFVHKSAMGTKDSKTKSLYLGTKHASDGSSSSRLEPPSAESFSYPTDATGSLGDFDPEARVWLLKYGLRPDELGHYGIEYSPSRHAILFTLRQLYGVPKHKDRGYIQRNFSKEKPKYYMNLSKEEPLPSIWISDPELSTWNFKHLVLCEDIVSAIKIGRTVLGGALLTSTLSADNQRYILSLYEHGYIERVSIFLDMDNATVRRNSRSIKDTLSLYIPYEHINVVTCYKGKDPKDIGSSELEVFLECLP